MNGRGLEDEGGGSGAGVRTARVELRVTFCPDASAAASATAAEGGTRVAPRRSCSARMRPCFSSKMPHRLSSSRPHSRPMGDMRASALSLRSSRRYSLRLVSMR